MNREETVIFLNEYFDALEKGEIEKIPLAPDVTLAGPMVGEVKGEESVRPLLIKVSQSTGNIKVVFQRHVIDGEHACSMFEMTLPTGETVSVLDYFHIVEGKIKWLQPYFDPRPMQEAWGWAEAERQA